jgi:hypothetical protein
MILTPYRRWKNHRKLITELHIEMFSAMEKAYKAQYCADLYGKGLLDFQDMFSNASMEQVLQVSKQLKEFNREKHPINSTAFKIVKVPVNAVAEDI